MFVYDGADPKTGKLVKNDTTVSLKILRASAALWREINNAIDEDSNFYSYDFSLGKEANEKAYSAGVASRKAPQWLAHEAEAMEAYKSTAEASKNALTKALGKTMTDRELQTALSGGGTIVMSAAEAEADVQEKLNWVIAYLNYERKNRDNPNRPRVLCPKPIRHTLNGMKGYKIYVACPAAREHSEMSNLTEAAIIIMPGIGLSYVCQHNSHNNDQHDWNWYRSVTEAKDDLSDSTSVAGVREHEQAAPVVETEDAMQPGPVTIGREFSDTGNLLRLRDRYGDKVRAVGKKVYVWDGKRWKEDHEKVRLYQMASKTQSLIKDEASFVEAEGEGEDAEKAAEAKRRAIRKWGLTSGNINHVNAIVTLASKATGIACYENPFDVDPWMLTVENGTLNLRTQKLHPHTREDMQSKMAPVTYDPSATCPTWDAFLARVQPEQEMREFLARALGYSMTGGVKEKVMFFFWGVGANGKTTFLETWGRVLGEDYAHSADMSLLVRKKFGENGIPTDIASLAGKRFVILSETDQRERFNESKLKKLASNERINARKLYETPASFKAVHKLFLGTNYKPLLVGTDNGLWRRLLLVGWDVSIPEPEQNKNIQEDLAREASSILNWGLRGLADYLASGLMYPNKVIAETAEWRDDSDQLKNFIRDNCEVAGNYKVQSGMLYNAYKTWAAENKEFIVSSKDFRARVENVGYDSNHVESGTIFYGLRLKGQAL